MIGTPFRRAAVGAALAAGLIAAAGPPAAVLVGPRPDLDAATRARVVRMVAPPVDFSAPEPFEAMAGGAATRRIAPGPQSFAQPAVGLSRAEEDAFLVGRAVFRKLWVAAPTSTHASDGVGPLFDARSCATCHVRDGRGRSPTPQGGDGFVMRLAAVGGDGVARPDPVYGAQLQTAAVTGLAPEGRVVVAWTPRPVTLADGTVVTLRAPSYAAADLASGPLDPATRLSPRVAPPLIGLGLLAAVDDGDILAAADPDDADGDGISGRPAWVADPGGISDPASGPARLGRFGWKAAQPTLASQTAAAFSVDMGLSTPLHLSPFGDCTAAETACLALPTGVTPADGPTEVPASMLDATVDYVATLAVPVRRDVGAPAVLAGKRIFHALGCAACHRPAYVTRRDAVPAAFALQPIRPYTDLLLHDMGDDLADGVPEGGAAGREWRTAPLWGIGLTGTVGPAGAGYLHDGRARDLVEAVLWHGGEAGPAREAFASLPAADRDALVAFLKSL